MTAYNGSLNSALRFHRFHERWNHSIKVQMIALGLLADEVDDEVTVDELNQRLSKRIGWLWGGMPDWSTPAALVAATRRDVGQAGVARAFSAFDLFLDELSAEVDRWASFSKKPVFAAKPERHEAIPPKEADRVAGFYERLSASRSGIEDIWPLYRYFRFARDCIVHREGLASDAMAQAYLDHSTLPELKRWIIKSRWHLPPVLVRPTVGIQLEFSQRQAIAASSTLRRIAFDLNRIVAEKIGKDGFLYLIADALFLSDEPPAEIGRFKSVHSALNWAMVDRHRVENYDAVEAGRILRELDLTRVCAGRFGWMKRQAAGSAVAPEREANQVDVPAEEPELTQMQIDEEQVVTRTAKNAVDEVIDVMSSLDDQLALLDQDLWDAFLEETGLEPERLSGGDVRVIYRNVDLRPSAAS